MTPLSQVSLFYSQVQDVFVNCIAQFEYFLVQYEHLCELFCYFLSVPSELYIVY